MIRENEFNEAINLKNDFFISLFHLILILSDFLIFFGILMFSISYLPEYISKFREGLFANNESVIFVGLSDVFLNFSIIAFLFLTYKIIAGIIFLFYRVTRIPYLKYLNYYYKKYIFWEFLNSYRIANTLSVFIITFSFLVSFLLFGFYKSMDSFGINSNFLFYKYKNISWDQINSIEYKLHLWYDKRRSKYKLREKFIYKGNFGELDILDANNHDRIINLIHISKIFSKVMWITDDPNEIQIKKFLNSYNDDEKNRIFEIYKNILNNY